MAAPAHPATRDRAAGEPWPPEHGDRLTRGEFRRRYAARPHLEKAESIEGVTTDGHRPYLIAVREAFGADVDYAMLIKAYGSAGGDGAAHRRYGPGGMNGAERMIVSACRTPRARSGALSVRGRSGMVSSVGHVNE